MRRSRFLSSLLLKEGGAERRKIECLAEAQSRHYRLKCKTTFRPGSILHFRKKLCAFGAFYLPPPTEAPSFKRRLSAVRRRRHLSSLSVAIAMHYNAIAMFVHHKAHKGPRLEARLWSMAAFYEFKAAVSDLIFHRAAKSGARRPACLKFSDAAT